MEKDSNRIIQINFLGGVKWKIFANIGIEGKTIQDSGWKFISWLRHGWVIYAEQLIQFLAPAFINQETFYHS